MDARVSGELCFRRDDLRDSVDFFRHITVEDQIRCFKKFKEMQPNYPHWRKIEDLLKDFDKLSEVLNQADGLENAPSEDLQMPNFRVKNFIKCLGVDFPKPREGGCLELDYMQLERLISPQTLGDLE